MNNQCLDCYKKYLSYFDIKINEYDIIKKSEYCKFCRKHKNNCIDIIRPQKQREIYRRYYKENYNYNYFSRIRLLMIYIKSIYYFLEEISWFIMKIFIYFYDKLKIDKK